MSLDNFLTYWNGIYGDYDGAFGPQCFDLANYYSRWIGGQPFTGATADLIYNQPGSFYTQIPNSPDNFPVRGDIVVFNWPHVGIATGQNTDANKFELLEQNDPTGSNCHLKTYENYNGVIGWLHPITLPDDPQAIIDSLRKERDTEHNNWQADEAVIKNLNQQINDRNNQITTLQGEKQTLQTQLESSQEEVNHLKPIALQVPGLQTQIDQYNIDKAKWIPKEQNYLQQIKGLSASSYMSASLWTILKYKLGL